MKLFLWKLKQSKNNDYDTYSDAVVVSSNPEAAKRIHPAVDSHTGQRMAVWDEVTGWRNSWDGGSYGTRGWVRPENVEVTCVGEAADWLGEGAVVCASFHAG